MQEKRKSKAARLETLEGAFWPRKPLTEARVLMRLVLPDSCHSRSLGAKNQEAPTKTLNSSAASASHFTCSRNAGHDVTRIKLERPKWRRV